MGYVVAGYTIVLSILFLYGLSLAWRRRRLTRAARRVASFSPVATPNPGAPAATSAASSGPDGGRLRP